MDIIGLVFFIVILAFSIILHEVMHGFVAERLGDPTARRLGRLTLNPIPHIDPVGTILLPAIMILPSLLLGAPIGPVFGWAKPVPVNPLNLREGRKDMALVGLAGPLTNIVIAVVFTVLYHIFSLTLFIEPIILNLWLAILNLIPIPPLDGSRFVAAFLPPNLAYQYDSIARYSIFIILILFFVPGISDPLFGFIQNILQHILIVLGIQ